VLGLFVLLSIDAKKTTSNDTKMKQEVSDQSTLPV
jgi:hypothetical protein